MVKVLGETPENSKPPEASVVAASVLPPMTEIDTPASAAPPVAAVTRPRTIAVVAICVSGMVPAPSVFPAKTEHMSQAELTPARAPDVEFIPGVRFIQMNHQSLPVNASTT